MASYDSYVRVQIPTTSEFLKQWHLWVHGKVSKHFKRDQDRIPDSVQRTRLRLLSKDFVSRWFFKHLTNDLVDLAEASAMLGGVPVTNVGALSPAYGKRSSPDSLWRITDILQFAKFDYERYFYTIQNHTIDTERFLRLLGYGKTLPNGKIEISLSDYGVLESLYRQGRVRPSEFTEHCCTNLKYIISSKDGLCGVEGCGSKHFSRGFCVAHYNKNRSNRCDECGRGKESLLSKGISLNHRWTDPSVAKAVAKLRWNDSQLSGYLRNWHNTNRIAKLPRYIMRPPKEATVDAGLLKYANMIIDNDVINYFKLMSRSEDAMSESTKHSDDNVFAMPSKDSNTEQQSSASEDLNIQHSEDTQDLMSIIQKACLTPEEYAVIRNADLDEMSVKEVSERMNMPVSKVTKIRNSALSKMRTVALRAVS